MLHLARSSRFFPAHQLPCADRREPVGMARAGKTSRHGNNVIRYLSLPPRLLESRIEPVASSQKFRDVRFRNSLRCGTPVAIIPLGIEHSVNGRPYSDLDRPQHVILIQVSSDERAGFDVDRASRIQACHDSADVNRVSALKYARAEPMVRIPAGSVMPGAQGNSRSVGRFLPHAVGPGVRRLDTHGSSADQTRQSPDPGQVFQISDGFHSCNSRTNLDGITDAAR